MNNHISVVTLSLFYFSMLLSMEKEASIPEDTAQDQVSQEENKKPKSEDSSWWDMLTIPKVGKWGSLAIWGSGATLLVGGMVYGAKRGVDAIKSHIFATALMSQATKETWSEHFMLFLGKASQHIPTISEIWEEHGCVVKGDPHKLLNHENIIAEFTKPEKIEFLAILKEYTIQLRSSMSEEGINFKGMRHLRDIDAEIGFLKDLQDFYCQKNGLENSDHGNKEPIPSAGL